MPVGVHPDYAGEVVFSAEGPQPRVWLETATLKAVLVGLEPGQQLPPHPAPAAVYHFLSGSGWMTVDGERVSVQAGATVTVPDGAKRGVAAGTRLAFLGVRAMSEGA